MLNLFTQPAEPLPIEVRWLTEQPAVVEIAAAGFDFPGLGSDFRQALQVNSILGMVAERDNRIVGYVIYEVHRCDAEPGRGPACPWHRRRPCVCRQVEPMRSGS